MFTCTLGSFFFALFCYNNGLSGTSFVQGLSHDTQTLFVREGDTVELDCNVVASSPRTEIFWYKYNVPIQDISYRTFEADVFKSSKLTLDNVLVADSGNYSCHLNDTLSSINRTFVVRVYETSKSRPEILKILLSNTSAILGSEADLHCHVTSDSVTYIRWYMKMYTAQVNASNNLTQNDLTEISAISPIKISSYEYSTLNTHSYRGEAVYRVQNVSFEDEGEYICEAFNEHGKVRHSAFLIVLNEPTPSADELEARYGALFEQAQELPIAMLIVVPAAFLVVLAAVFIRALEKAKQRHALGLKTDRSGNNILRKEDFDANKGCPDQKGDKEMAISDSRWIQNYCTTRNGVCHGVRNTGQQTVQLTKTVTCEAVTCSCDSFPSLRVSDVTRSAFSSKRCSEDLELEWEGLELVMGKGFKVIKLCKEEEV